MGASPRLRTTYVSPLLRGVLPISPDLFMQVVGAIEMVVGILILSGAGTRLGAYIVSAYLVLIVIALVTNSKYFDIAVRDVVMALGAFTLARLTEAREVVGAAGVCARGLTSRRSASGWCGGGVGLPPLFVICHGALPATLRKAAAQIPLPRGYFIGIATRRRNRSKKRNSGVVRASLFGMPTMT